MNKEYGCYHCPIYQYTGEINCRGTPNHEFEQTDYDDPIAKRKRIAQEEVKFLKEVYKHWKENQDVES
jgi:hypothetical protein